jgi:heat shock protein HtpX
MPLTFIDIERRKNWMILVFFLMLLALYAGTCFALTAPFLPRVAGRPSTDGLRNFRYAVLGAAVLLSALHILLAGYDAAAAMVRRLGARPPDPEDEVHRRLLNVMQEIHVVTGGRSTIECVVIPSLSLNALAASDLRGRSIIGITEGLLSRLNRQQLEGVIAHEAQHILSGDCLETTVAASLFGGLSSLIEKSSDSSQTGVIPPVLWPAWALVKIGQLLNLFISREREYRADAAAVRMTRDPLALAETLHLLSRSWRGAGFIGSGFEMICIVNPVATALDETEGFWADLFSTHPPIRKRIDLLLAMAHADSTVFTAKAREDRPGSDDGGYYALDPRRQWQGPFSTPELAALPWLSPLTWIASRDGQQPDRAWKIPVISAVFAARLSATEQPSSGMTCPSCHQPLATGSYAGTQIDSCRFCGGNLVSNERIPRILARTGQEKPCTERIRALGRAAMSGNLGKIRGQRRSSPADHVPLLSCPKCGHPMSRAFFSAAYLIDVDRCLSCGVTWFDEDELAMVQCLIAAVHAAERRGESRQNA